VRRNKSKPRKPWQGRGSKAEEGKELTAPCGCTFRCEPFYWGSNVKKIVHGRVVKPKPSGYFWFRIKDCPKVKALDKNIP